MSTAARRFGSAFILCLFALQTMPGLARAQDEASTVREGAVATTAGLAAAAAAALEENSRRTAAIQVEFAERNLSRAAELDREGSHGFASTRRNHGNLLMREASGNDVLAKRMRAVRLGATGVAAAAVAVATYKWLTASPGADAKPAPAEGAASAAQ